MITRRLTLLWTLRALFFATAVACVYFLDGGSWFFGGLGLGFLWAVLEVAAVDVTKGGRG